MKVLRGLLLGLALAGISSSATAIPIALNYLVGTWDGQPQNVTEATANSQVLVNWYNGGPAPTPNTENFMVAMTGLGTLPSPVQLGVKTDTSTPIEVTAGPGLEYLLGKYGTLSVLYYVGGIADGEAIVLPPKFNNNGISHQVVFGATTVPDGGLTVALLGLGLAALAGVWRFGKR